MTQSEQRPSEPVSEMTPAKVAAAFLEWMDSPEGREHMRKSAEERAEFIERLKAARNVPWEKLHEPFTI